MALLAGSSGALEQDCAAPAAAACAARRACGDPKRSAQGPAPALRVTPGVQISAAGNLLPTPRQLFTERRPPCFP